MQVIHIVPVENTATAVEYNPCMMMCLTHLVEKYPAYADAMKKYSGYKILDNSLIELGGAMDLERVVAAAQQIDADEIILPDKFMDCEGTLDLVVDSIKRLEDSNMLGKYKLMAVAHGSNYVEWTHCFKELEKMDAVDVIGIPKVLAKMHQAGRPAFESIWEYSSKMIHLLGLWYSWFELAEYHVPKKIRSCDTCLAAYQSLYGIKCIQSPRPDGFTIDLEKAVCNPLSLGTYIEEAECILNETRTFDKRILD